MEGNFMELTELDFFPPTGSNGAEYLINGTHYKFDTTAAEWLSQEKPVKSAEPVKPAATK
jgi:hypothetical protein